MKLKIGWIVVAISGALGAIGSELISQIISNKGLLKIEKDSEKKNGGE